MIAFILLVFTVLFFLALCVGTLAAIVGMADMVNRLFGVLVRGHVSPFQTVLNLTIAVILFNVIWKCIIG